MKTKTKRNEAAQASCAPAAGSAAGWKRCADEMPDSDSTVMIHHAEEDEPVWMGYHDGETWRLVDGARCAVSHWMPLPEPPSGDDKRQSDKRECGQHPGNSESAAYDEENCTEETRREFIALRREAV